MSRWNPFTDGMEVVIRGGDETARGIVVESFPERMVIEIQGDGSDFDLGQTVQIVSEGAGGRLSAEARIIGRETAPVRIAVTCMSPGAEQREYVRVEDSIPIGLERIRLGEEDAIRARFITPPPGVLAEHAGGEEEGGRGEMEDINPALIRRLKTIEDKLDMILAHFELEQEGMAAFPTRHVSLSGAGVKLFSGDRFEVGDHVLVKLVLPLAAPVGLETAGCVAWVKEHPDRASDRWETAIRFDGITEDVRDAIIHYTFQRQREMLRSRWEG